MIRIAQFYTRYDMTIEETELNESGERLLRFAEETTRGYFGDRYNDYGITASVQIEIGSTKSWIRIGALLTFLSHYGSVREGLISMVEDASALASLIIPGVSEMLGLADQAPKYNRRTFGVSSKLLRLFEQVERSEIAANEATGRAIRLLEAEGGLDIIEEIPRLKERLATEFCHAEELTSSIGGQYGLPSNVIETAKRAQEKPSPIRRDPVLAPVPGTNRRRRRKGVIVTRNPETDVQICQY
jgi:hypothetical protein